MASAVKVALIAMSKFHYIDCSMVSPEDCKTLQDVRLEIDRLEGLDPGVIEDLYRRLVAYFIERELGHWRERE